MDAAPTGSVGLTVGVFVVIGPPVGGLILYLALLPSGFGSLSGSMTLLEACLQAPLVMLIAYPFGALPAAVSGLLLGQVSARLRSRRLWLGCAGLVGGGASMLMLGLDSLMGIAGIVAGLSAGVVALQVRPRWT